MSSEELKVYPGPSWNYEPQQQPRASGRKSGRGGRVREATRNINHEMVRHGNVSKISKPVSHDNIDGLSYVEERLAKVILSSPEDGGLSQFQENESLTHIAREINRYKEEGEPSAWEAVFELSKQAFLKMVTNSLDINSQDENGNTLLHLACENNMLEIAYCLLVSDAKIDIRNKNGLFPSFDKCRENGNTILHYLLNPPAEGLCAETEIKVTPVKLCESILRKNPALLNTKNAFGITPLMYACKNGNVDCLKLLLQQPRINLKITDGSDKNAVHYAVESKNPEIIEIVLKRCQTPVDNLPMNQPIDEDENTILHYAFRISNLKFLGRFVFLGDFSIQRNDDIAPLFISNKFGVTPVSCIVNSKNFATNRELLRAIDFRIEKGNNNLLERFAAEVAKLDQEAKDFVLALSILDRQYHISKALFKKGADCNRPIHREILYRHEKIVNIGEKMPNGANILMFLLYVRKNDGMARTILQEYPVNIDATAGGLNLLHFACLGGHVDIFKELLRRNVDIKAVGCEGKLENVSVLKSAVRGRNEEILDILLGLVDIRSTDALMSFDYAIEQESYRVVYKFLVHNFSVEPLVKNFDFFIKAYNTELDEEIKLHFKRGIQEMISKCPELLLHMVKDCNGEILFERLKEENRELDNVVEDLIRQQGVVARVFPELVNIIAEVSNNNIGDLERYLEKSNLSKTSIKIIRFYVNSLPREWRLTESWQVLDNTFLRYDQISKVDIEKDGLPPHDVFKMALFIECHIVKIQDFAEEFFCKRSTLPRPIILFRRNIVVLTSNKLSNLQIEGGQKRINSAALVSLDNMQAEPKSVVVAKIRPEKLKIDEHRKEAIRNSLRYEWQIMEKFKGIEGFVQGHYFCNTKSRRGNICYVMDKYEGSIGKFVEETLPVKKQIMIANQAIIYLKTMHDMNVMHRDIKPKNILFEEVNQNIKIAIADFGCSMMLQDEIDDVVAHGTGRYDAPEGAYGLEEGKPSRLSISEKRRKLDIYALGLTLFMLFNGKKFPVGENDDITTVDIEEFEVRHKETIKDRLEFLLGIKQNLGVDGLYEIVILKMLSYFPEDRISLEEALQEIHNLMASYELNDEMKV